MKFKLIVTLETDDEGDKLAMAKAFAEAFHTGGDVYANINGQELVAQAQDATVYEIDGMGIPEEEQ